MATDWRRQLSPDGWNALRYITGAGQEGGRADVYDREIRGETDVLADIGEPPDEIRGDDG